jgi:hypothetical protein
MADVYISIAWIQKDPLDRARKFIHYGLEQAKLELEHRKAEIARREIVPGEEEFIQASSGSREWKAS